MSEPTDLDQMLTTFFGAPTQTTINDGGTTQFSWVGATPLMGRTFPGFETLCSEAELYERQLSHLTALSGHSSDALQAAAMRDPGGMGAVRQRVLIGGALEYTPGWYLDWLCRPLPSVRDTHLAIARQARLPFRQGRPVWRAHTRKRWGQHG